MGGKKRNAYASFVDNYAKKTGMPIQEAFRVCGDLWARLSEEERNAFKTGRGTRVPLDTFGNPVTSAEEEIRIQEEQAFRVKQFVETRLDRNAGQFPVNVVQEFVLVSVNFFCKPSKGQAVPAEIAAARFSIMEGVSESFHEILRPKAIPEGYLRETIQRAEKGHNIPHNNSNVGEEDYNKVKKDLHRFLKGETGEPAPVFCPQYEIEDVAEALKNLLDEGDVEVFDLGVILSEIQYRVQDPEEPVTMISADAANHYFEEDTFLYKTPAANGCGFHQSVDNVKFCSLNVVKRRVWSICEKSTRVLGLTLKAGKHVPAEEVWNGQEERKPFADSDDEEEMDAFQRAAVVKKFKNPFGTRVPRCGTMGGHTPLPGRDPTIEIREKIKDAEKKLSDDLLNLSVRGTDPTNVAYKHWRMPATSRSESSEPPPSTSGSITRSPSGTEDFLSSADEDDDVVSVVSITSDASAMSASSRRSRPKIWANFVTQGREPPPMSSTRDYPALPKRG